MSAANSFAGYRCWDPSNIHKVLDYEAGRLADAVLLAAHSPANITVGTDPDRIDRIVHGSYCRSKVSYMVAKSSTQVHEMGTMPSA